MNETLPREESSKARGDAVDSGLTINECPECQGEGELLTGDGTNNPDAKLSLEDCEKCNGTGNAECPCCTNPAAYLVRGDGRCIECVSYSALQQVEDSEPASMGNREAA